MKIIIDGVAFSGNPTEIVDTLRELLFEETVPPDIEGYIAHIQHAYIQVFGREMVLPQATLDGRIRAMFAILEDAGLMKVVDVEASTSLLDEMPKMPFSAEVVEYA